MIAIGTIAGRIPARGAVRRLAEARSMPE